MKVIYFKKKSGKIIENLFMFKLNFFDYKLKFYPCVR